jgi:hypothetical protein
MRTTHVIGVAAGHRTLLRTAKMTLPDSALAPRRVAGPIGEWRHDPT